MKWTNNHIKGVCIFLQMKYNLDIASQTQKFILFEGIENMY